jgi:hypothetical protein
VVSENDDEVAEVDTRTAARAGMTQQVQSGEQTKITAFAHTREETAATTATAEANRAMGADTRLQTNATAPPGKRRT